ncbi:MAG TPA: DUF1648 domain-containing protein [Candidatus Acidoferrum sp.]|nr:DUF1648 domain-containing protein [Candidatus Acidoferrum sp.]
MDDARYPKIVYFLMVVAGLFQWVRFYPLLPERMASHFSYDGTPNAWQPKDAFFLLMLVVVGLTFFGAFLTPRFIAARPDKRINLPHKDYWLAPTRREETFRFIAAQMAWSGCAMLFVLLFATFLAIRANLSSDGRFDNGTMIKVLAVFIFLMVLWIVHFLRRFYRLPADSSARR